MIDAAEVATDEDLFRADYPGVQRLWLLTLPGPFAQLARAEAQLVARGAVAEGAPLRFGPLRLQAWDLRAPPLAADLLAGALPGASPEWHEVQYASRRCRMLPIGTTAQPAQLTVRGEAGATLQLRAGLIGEQAYDFRSTVHVELFEVVESFVEPFEVKGPAAGAAAVPLATLEVGRTVDPEPAWQRAAVPLAPGAAARDFRLRISTAGQQRPPLCVSLWSTR